MTEPEDVDAAEGCGCGGDCEACGDGADHEGNCQRRATNVEFVTQLMEYSRSGALMQAFVMTAIQKYAEQVQNAGPDFDKKMEHSLVHPEAWRRCAEETLEALDRHFMD